MKTRRHPWTGGTGEIVVDAAAHDTIVLQVESRAPYRRGEGLGVTVDASIGSVSVCGIVEIMASVAMTDAEARKLIVELERALVG